MATPYISLTPSAAAETHYYSYGMRLIFFFFLIVTYTRRLSGQLTADPWRADVQGSPISAHH